MGSENFIDVEVIYNGIKLGFFKEIVINSNEIRLYNPDLIKVLTFDNYSVLRDPFRVAFYGEDDVEDFEYQAKPEEETDECRPNPKPNHYFNNGIMAWDIIDEIWKYYHGLLDESEVFYLGNIFKYLFRLKTKGQFESDIDKIKVYCDRLKEHNERLS